MPGPAASPRTIVAGAGISGLVTAHRLLQKDPGLDLVVLEAANRAGGTLGTDRIDGFAFERGPNGFLDGVTQTLDLARELGLADRLLPAAGAAKKRFLVKNGRLVALPSSPSSLLTTPLLTWGGKLRLLSEPFRSSRRGGTTANAEESVAEFARRRLGAEVAATFLDPMVTGIYAGDPEEISLNAAFPRLAALEREHGSLLRGLLARARARQQAPAGPGRLWSFGDGMEELAGGLAARLGERLRLGVPLEAVRCRPQGGFDCQLHGGRVEPADLVVLATPSPVAARLVESLSGELSAALGAIPYASIAVVCLGFRRADVAHPLDGFGFLTSRSQGLRILGAIFVSTIFPRHAPPDTVSLRVLIGGARDPGAAGLSGGELEALALTELRPLLGLRGEPIARKTYRYAQGIPQYNRGHLARVQRIEAAARAFPGLLVTGNAYRGVGVNDCVSEGQRIAVALSTLVGERAGNSKPASC